MSKIKLGKIQRIEEKPSKKASDYDKPDKAAHQAKTEAAFRESVIRYTNPEEYLKKQGKKVKF